MRRIAIVAGGGLVWLAGCGVEGIFACSADAQCTWQDRGACVSGGCAYPDEDCESGMRFSTYAQEPGACVPVDSVSTSGSTTMSTTDDTTTTTVPDPSSSSEDESSTGEPVPDCTGVDCSGHGTCVMLDGAPMCACDATYWRVGLQCLDDPCESKRCFFVDAEQGSDDADGSRDAPWATLARIGEAALEPGDAVLLRRGRTWAEPLRTPSAPDDAELPITIGAYGPRGDGAPVVSNINVNGDAHLELRDLRVESTGTVCAVVSRSHHITIRDSLMTGCGTRGVRVDDDSHHTAIVSNRFEGEFSADPIGVLDLNWKAPVPIVGDHHWIVDNEVAVTGTGVDVGIVANGVALTDVKIVGNRVAGPMGSGIHVRGGNAWIAGNTVAVGGDESWRACISLDAVEQARVSGNVVFECLAPLRVTNDARIRFERNTVLHAGTVPAAVFGAVDGLVFRDNLVASAAPLFGTTTAELRDIAELDANWYVDADSDCEVEIDGASQAWADFVATTALDGASTCGPGPIDGVAARWSDPSQWTGAFWSALTPDSGWERCDDPAGALDCEGARMGTELHPLSGFDDNGGKGWEGPLEVRLRWPMRN